MAAIRAASQDPRAWIAWRAGQSEGRRLADADDRRPFDPARFRPVHEPRRSSLSRDWSIYLGTNGTAPADVFPAKFTFDITATPNCANDYIIYPINAPGTSTQPNIVALNNLYSGTAGGNGICNRTPSGSDTGVAATVMWSYNIQATSVTGAITNSPEISYDPVNPSNSGTKVAFVESVASGQIESAAITAGHAGTGYKVNDTGTISGGSGTATYQVTGVLLGVVTSLSVSFPGSAYAVANGVGTTKTSGNGSGLEVNILTVSSASSHFHILAWGSGSSAGQNSSNLQSVFSPVTINSFSSTTPAAGSGTATDLAFSANTSTLSSPFIDYVNDLAYVGDDSGVLYRIKNVFCTSVNTKCGSKPVPSLDSSWGSGGAVTVCSGELTGPVLDYVTLNVFVGCSDGKLYLVSQSGTIKSTAVGDGVASKTYGGIVDPPIVDGADGFVYAVTGSANGAAYGALVQATTNFATSVTVQVGAGNQCNMHAPALNNAYYTSPTTAGALIYVGGVTGTVSQPCSASSSVTGGDIFLYGATFGSGGVLTSGTPTHSFNCGGGPGSEWVSMLEFYNPATSIDWLFMGALQSNQTNFASENITSGFPTGFTELVTEGLGQSGMVVDNDSASAQAASVYFNAVGENAACTNNTVLTATGGCAVKLTQAALQ